MNSKTIDPQVTEYYCVLCSTVIDIHICFDCNDYALTFAEAVMGGHL